MAKRNRRVLNDRSARHTLVSIQYLNATQSDSMRFRGIHLEREVKDKRLNMNEMNAKACKHERSRYQGGCKRSDQTGTGWALQEMMASPVLVRTML